MSIGGRLFRALRANVGHAVRRLTRDELGAAPSPTPELDAADRPGEEAPHPGARARARAGVGPRKTRALEKAYGALELPFGASPETIKKAHRALLRKYHPDRFARDPDRLQTATRLSQELGQARDLLLEAHAKGWIG